MRVLLTTPYDLAVPGGVNQHALGLLDAMGRRGVEVLLVGPSSAPGSEGDARIRPMGKVSVGRLNGAKSRVTLDLSVAPALSRIIRGFAPDVIHAQEPFVPALNTFALLEAGKARRIGTFHTFSESSLGYLWAWPWCRWVNSMLDARIAVSESARDFVRRFHPAHYEVIPNGTRIPGPNDRRKPLPLKPPVRLLFVGRADESRKGFGVLAEAFRLLNVAQPGRFVLNVAGPSRPPGAAGILYLGKPDPAALSRAYAEADITVVPSVAGESFGLVALESLSHRVPVVASRIRGFSDWLDGSGAARLFESGNPHSLKDTLSSIASDPQEHERMAACAVETSSKFEWVRVVDRILALYSGP
jgi:phosphatidylinositol alpha-mannosyltransferase